MIIKNMKLNSRFWTELWYLLLFIATGFVIVFGLSFVTAGIFTNQTVNLHVLQWEQNVFVFIVPTLIWVHWYLKQPVCTTLGLHKAQPKYYLLAVLLIMLLSFPMDWFASWAKDTLPWPESLRQMAEAEAIQQESILQLLLAPSGFFGWMENILLMSVATAIAEEFVFRGALLSCFRRADVGQHLTAIAVGFIFALIHFDLYGLLPRWVLGSLFCYLYYWSGSLWPAVTAHAINNFMALLQYKNGELF